MALPTVRLKETMTQSELIEALNQNFALIENITTTQIFKDKAGTQRMLIGQGPDDELYVKVSEPGKDVITATDDELYFNSSQNTLKVAKVDTITLSRPGGSLNASIEVAHGLGYAPVAICYMLIDGAYVPLPYHEVTPTGLGSPTFMGVDKEVTFNTDSTYIRFHTSADGYWVATSESFTIKYYLLQEKAV